MLNFRIYKWPAWLLVIWVVAIFSSVYMLGGRVANDGVSYYLHKSALIRMQDWAEHLGEEYPEIAHDLSRGDKAEDFYSHLKREARQYNALEVSIVPVQGERKDVIKITSDKDQLHVSGGIAGQLMGIFRQDNPHRDRVTVAIRNARGKVVAHLEATVDQSIFKALMMERARRVIMVGLLGLLLMGAVAFYAYRMMAADASRQLKAMSGVDMLTGLPNRTRFSTLLSEMFMQADREKRLVALLHVNIAEFKKISSSNGYEAADELLLIIARRIEKIAGSDSIICRLDGDEFAVAAVVDSEHEAHRFGELLLAELEKPLLVHGRKVHCTISIGAAIYPLNGATHKKLEQRAAFARMMAKRDGGGCLRFFNESMEEEQASNMEVERRLKQAVADDDFDVHFQPLVNLKDNTLYGFEALVRLRHEDGSIIPPDMFISVAEKLNLMDDLGSFVLRESCRVAAQWPDHLKVAVNVSPSQFASGKLPMLVRKALKDSGLAAERLEIEVTESLIVEDSPAIREQLNELNKLGAHIVLDDFGTGYSSLNYLWRFQFDKVKIDRSFVRAIDTSSEARTILRAMMVMFRALGVKVTAEGIEEAHQAGFMRKLRCDTGQGYYYSKPLPPEELASVLLKDWKLRAEKDDDKGADVRKIA